MAAVEFGVLIISVEVDCMNVLENFDYSIPGYEPYYFIRLVNSDWQVISLKRVKVVGEKILHQSVYAGNYVGVGLMKNRKASTYFVHELVLMVFHGECPAGKESCHRDGNPRNNHPDNLYWGTHQENMDDVKRLGKPRKATSCRGSNHPVSKVTEDQVLQIRELLATSTFTQKAIAATFGVHSNTIRDILRRRTWKHL